MTLSIKKLGDKKEIPELEENEKDAQEACGTIKQSKFTLARSIPVTLDVELVIEVKAPDLSTALKRGEAFPLPDLTEHARKNLKELTNGYWSSVDLDQKEMIVRRAIAKGMQTPGALICISVEGPYEEAE